MYGNFMENGPLNLTLGQREFAWSDVANMLYVDQPAGTGFRCTIAVPYLGSVLNNNTHERCLFPAFLLYPLHAFVPGLILSYVDDPSLHPTTEEELAADVVEMLAVRSIVGLDYFG
jgi:serine carboxypeptidase